MYKEHEAFAPPPPDAVLWRYMDFTKFVSLLEKQALFFARADKLKDDPFEGAWPNLSRERLQKFFEELNNPNRDQLLQTSLTFIKVLPRFTLINCWHESPHESAAMWKLYATDDNGIAIKTDFDSFKRSLTCSESIYVGRISYVDYENHFIPENNLFSPFLHKRQSFEHEREVRAITVEFPLKAGTDNPPCFEIDDSQDICDVGIYYEVDLSLLIQEVIVAPYAPDWLIELVQSVATRYDLKAPVIKSRLGDPPTWG